MASTEIEFTIGMARDGIGSVYYMLGEVETEDGIIELYAEAPMSDSDETCTYETLREKILEQAAEEGIGGDSLVFYYD